MGDVEAKSRLSDLVCDAAQGHDVIVARNGHLDTAALPHELAVSVITISELRAGVLA